MDDYCIFFHLRLSSDSVRFPVRKDTIHESHRHEFPREAVSGGTSLLYFVSLTGGEQSPEWGRPLHSFESRTKSGDLYFFFNYNPEVRVSASVRESVSE